MSTEFEREERYIVFKLSDVEERFTPGERQQLARLAGVQRVGRSEAGKPPLECVVVESDWPEYEPTWKAIEARVTGAQPAPSGEDDAVRKSWARFKNELHRSPDAPYPGMSEAFEQHFSQSFTDREWRAESATWAAAWKAAKRHEAQAMTTILENANGVRITEGDKMHGHHIAVGALCCCGEHLIVAPTIYQADHRKGDPVMVCRDHGVHAYRFLELVMGQQPEAKP